MTMNGNHPAPAKAPEYPQQNRTEEMVFDAINAMTACMAFGMVESVMLTTVMVPTPTNVSGDPMPGMVVVFRSKNKDPNAEPETLSMAVPRDGRSFLELVVRAGTAMTGMIAEAEREGLDVTPYRMVADQVNKLRRNGKSRILLPGQG